MREFDSEGFCKAGFDKNGFTKDKKHYKAIFDIVSGFFYKKP